MLKLEHIKKEKDLLSVPNALKIVIPKTPNDMSDKAKEYLENYDPQIKEVGYDNYFYSPKQVIERMQSYAEQHLEDVLGESEKELYRTNEYHVIQNPTDYDYRDVEAARKVFNGAKWILNLLKQRTNGN